MPDRILIAMRVAPSLPEGLVRGLLAAGGFLAWARRGKKVRRLESNLLRARPRASRREIRRLARQAMLRYMRYYAEILTAPRVAHEVIDARVRIINAEEVYDAVDQGIRPVIAMGHLANWDYAGAWAVRNLAPATSVAERLNPPQVFEEYVRLRGKLGISIVPADKGKTFSRLLEVVASTEPGIVPIVADRDLTSKGIEVTLLGEAAMVAPGPAALARATGVPLIPLGMYSERLTGARRKAARSRWGYVLQAYPSVSRRPDLPREEEVQVMTQEWVNAISETIAAHPADWHMLQRVFAADLDPSRAPRGRDEGAEELAGRVEVEGVEELAGRAVVEGVEELAGRAVVEGVEERAESGRRGGARMRIGIVCPYSFDVPGGVQFHIRDLASALIARGHEVSVLAPAEPTTPVPEYVTATGGSVKVHFNGSVARLAFGPRVAARTRRWLAAGNFDVLHIHEPICPSLSLLALWAASGPIVATFHSFQERSRTLSMASTLTRAPLEKIRGAIAVSPAARGTLTDHNLGGDAVIIPNGVFVEPYARAIVNPDWVGTPDAPTLAFLGRLDEPRKGLDILLAAIPQIRARVPGARFLVAGNGEIDSKRLVSGVEILGPVSEEDKARLLKSADLYIAPHTGGESFGIVLIEAMSAGAGVVASDLPAFRTVLDDGALGTLVDVADPAALAQAVVERLADREGTASLADRAAQAVHRYDWSEVTDQILAVYETVAAGSPVTEDPGARRWMR